MNIITQLKSLGLSEKESNVYLACISSGAISIQNLARKTDINRTTVYRIVDALKHHHLVTLLPKNKRGLVIAEDVQNLKKDLEFRQQTLEDLVPQLYALASPLSDQPQIKLFEGEESLKKVTFETAEQKDTTFYTWYSYNAVPLYGGEQFEKRYIALRKKNRVYAYVITDKNPTSEKYKKTEQQELRQVRYYQNKNIKFDVDIYIYGTKKVAIMNRKALTALVIENPEIYSMMKTIFLSNWEQLRES